MFFLFFCCAIPLTLIQEDVEDALIPFSEFCGTFAEEITYRNAPDPRLEVYGLGPISLPLSSNIAQGLVRESRRSIQDNLETDSSGSLWEIPHHKVSRVPHIRAVIDMFRAV